jgi:hypothetical protein
MIAYDAAVDLWSIVFDEAPAPDGGYCFGPRCRLDGTTVYDPVNKRLVVHGGSFRDQSRVRASQTPGPSPAYEEPAHGPENGEWVQDDSVLAFDLATRTWTVLLDATGVSAAQ